MYKLLFASLGGLLAALLPVCMVAAGAAQNPPSSNPAPSTTSATQTSTKPNANDEFLANIGKLYYSTSKTGLKGFDCAVHPDWRALLVSATQGSAIAADDHRILLLKTVKIKLHARLNGGFVLDWNPSSTLERPMDQDSIHLFDLMHLGIGKTVQNFMQFWAPLVNGRLVPSSSDGLEIIETENGHRIRRGLNGSSLTEEVDSSLILKHFDLVTSGLTVRVASTYRPTDQGMLVSGFLASYQPSGAPAGQANEMRVEVVYQTVGGSPIPARVNVDDNNLRINSVLDGCTVNP